MRALPGAGTLGAPFMPRGGNAPPVSRRYRAECPPKGKFRWNRGRYVRPELRLGAFLFKEVNLLNESHRALAIETVKNILHVLHEKRYQDLPSCVDEMEWADTD